MKASRLMLLGEVHRAVVTRADFDDVDGLHLDSAIAEAAGFFDHEKVELHDVSTGTRLGCHVRFAAPGSGTVALTGAAAHHVKPGELISISSFGWMKGKAAAKHQPRMVNVDDENHVIAPKKSKLP